MRTIRASECGFDGVLRGTRTSNAGDAMNETRLIKLTIDTIHDDRTLRYSLPQKGVIEIITSDEETAPGEIPHWPHDGPIYVEYEQPVPLTPDHDDEPEEFLYGVEILPERDYNTIIAFGRSERELLFSEHRQSRETGELTIMHGGQPMTGQDNSDDERIAKRFYLLLAQQLSRIR